MAEMTPSELLPRHDLLHRRKKGVALGLLALLLVAIALIGRNRQGLMLHLHLRAFGTSIQANLAPATSRLVQRSPISSWACG